MHTAHKTGPLHGVGMNENILSWYDNANKQSEIIEKKTLLA